MQEDEIPQAIADTRDKALLEIMSGGAQEWHARGWETWCHGGAVLWGVFDGLTKPRSTQIEKAHGLLERKGKNATECVKGLVKLALVANKLRTQKRIEHIIS